MVPEYLYADIYTGIYHICQFIYFNVNVFIYPRLSTKSKKIGIVFYLKKARFCLRQYDEKSREYQGCCCCACFKHPGVRFSS